MAAPLIHVLTGDPRDPVTAHRAAATYNAWFRPTVGRVLAHAVGRTGTSACRRVQANLRLRLGALPTAVILGGRGRTPFHERSCPACAGRGEGQHVGDVLHACFQCSHMQEVFGDRWGWAGPPGGAADFHQLYRGDMRKAIAFGADIVDLVEGC